MTFLRYLFTNNNNGGFQCNAYNNKPSFLDYEYIVFCTETNHWLLVIFDAFEEICKRLKEEKSDD